MGVGIGTGENRAVEAAKPAITSPLIEEQIDGAKGMLLNVTGGEDLGLFEVNEAARMCPGRRHERQHRLRRGRRLVDAREVRVTVIATGFEGFEMIARAPEFTARRAERRPAAVDRGRETLSDLRDLGVRDRRSGLPEVVGGVALGRATRARSPRLER